MFAVAKKLDNLITITDYNKLQIDGTVEQVIGIEDLVAKWTAFGWDVQRIDGHDFNALENAFNAAHEQNGKPKMIVCDTIKAKGLPKFEGQIGSHNANITLDEVKELYNGEVPSWLK